MKIAIVTSGFLPVVDGVTTAVSQRLRYLSQWGHEVLVLCPSYEAIASVYPNWQDFVGDYLPGVRVVPLPSESFMGLEFERNLSRAAQIPLTDMLDAFRPDVIHVDEPDRLFIGLGKLPGVEWARAHQVPCFAFYHTNFLDYMEDFFPLPFGAIAPLRWVAKKAITCRSFNAYDATLTASSATYQKIQAYGIHNAILGQFLGVDVAAFQSAARHPHFWASYGLPQLDDAPDLLKVLFLGRLTPDKGWGFTRNALEQWPSGHPAEGMVLIIAGDGNLRGALEDSFQQMGVRAHFLGRVPSDAVPALMVHSDVHISASRKETWGLTALEAAAAGIPALVPGAGGFLDTVQDGRTGLHFVPGDVADFLGKWVLLVRSPELRQTLGSQGRDFAAHFDWEPGTQSLVQVWREGVQGKWRQTR